jgi:IclR family pca regulon transcriptional regulator
MPRKVSLAQAAPDAPPPLRRLDPKEGKSAVQSLAKGLRVLEAFRDGAEIALKDVAAAALLDRGTAFRLLNTLVDAGYVVRDPDGPRYRLSLKVLDLGFNAIAHTDIRALVRPRLESLVDQVNEAASFGILDGGDVLYIERVRAGFTRLGVDIRVGTTIPASVSTIGFALLAFEPAEDLERALSTPPRHPHSIPTPSRARLAALLARVRKQGFLTQSFVDLGGLLVLAAPVLGPNGRAVGAISVTAPMVRVQEEEFERRTAPHVVAAAKELGRALEIAGTTPILPRQERRGRSAH